MCVFQWWQNNPGGGFWIWPGPEGFYQGGGVSWRMVQTDRPGRGESEKHQPWSPAALEGNITCCLVFVSSVPLACMNRSASDWNDESCSYPKRSTRRRLNMHLSNEKLDERFISSPLSVEKLLYCSPSSSGLAAPIALAPSVYLSDFPPPLLGTFAAPPQNINRFPSRSEICSSVLRGACGKKKCPTNSRYCPCTITLNLLLLSRFK